MMALVGIRATIDKSEIMWSWVYAQFVPMGFGVDFTRKLEQLIDREVIRFARTAESQSKRRSK